MDLNTLSKRLPITYEDILYCQKRLENQKIPEIEKFKIEYKDDRVVIDKLKNSVLLSKGVKRLLVKKFKKYSIVYLK